MLPAIATLAFILLLTGLILIHEVGHFLVARLSGVKVEEFGFGLPPCMLTLFHWRGTRFTWNWIPVGGFVRLKGEGAMTASARMAKGSFARAGILRRSAILLAGVSMNFLLAFLIFLVGFSVGGWVPTYRTIAELHAARERGDVQFTPSVVIEDVVAGAGADAAGILRQSILLKVDSVRVSSPEDLVREQVGKRQVRYTLLLGSPTAQESTVLVRVQEGKTGVLLRAIPRDLIAKPRSIIPSSILALRESWVVMVQTVRGMGALFLSVLRSASVPKEVTGIIGIAHLTYASVQEGVGTYLRLVALLSLSLAALNVLPFPALDGGRLLFVLLECFWRKPSSRRVELAINMVGFSVLIGLIVLVTFYDILRLFIVS
ncbi:site-2 protease family protein [Candidatus Peregrinibacteria bacterium]|nr:site-2 protease family protein [Candidatus Peregrinibacteria bacterium]